MSHVQRAQQPFGSCTIAAQRPSGGITNVSVYSWLLPSTDFNALSRMRAHTKILTCTFQLKKKKSTWNLIITDLFSLCNRVHVTSSRRNSLLPLVCVCVKGSYVSVNGRSSMPCVFTCTRANSSYCLSSSTGTNCPDNKWFIAVFVLGYSLCIMDCKTGKKNHVHFAKSSGSYTQ